MEYLGKTIWNSYHIKGIIFLIPIRCSERKKRKYLIPLKMVKLCVQRLLKNKNGSLKKEMFNLTHNEKIY